MRNYAVIIAAGTIAATGLVAGAASAENMNSAFSQMVNTNTYGTPQSPSDNSPSGNAVGYQYEPGFLARAERDNVGIRYVSELPKQDKVAVLDRAAADPDHVAAIQSDIRSNPTVAHDLRAQNVEIHNVIDKIEGTDGSTTYVVR